MNKYFFSLLLSQTIFFTQSTQIVAPNAFAKLSPTICKQAEMWSEKVVTTLPDDLQLTFLNLFALNAAASVEKDEEQRKRLVQAFIKCAEYIESQKDMLALFEELSTNIMDVLKTYAENIHEKIAKKNISEKEKQVLGEKLYTKIQELHVYINTIYYQTLYKNMAKKSTSLTYMFDEKGIISTEKRIRSLPMII